MSAESFVEHARALAELEGKVQILATALREIEEIADNYMDLGREDLSAILGICRIGGVRTAMEFG